MCCANCRTVLSLHAITPSQHMQHKRGAAFRALALLLVGASHAYRSRIFRGFCSVTRSSCSLPRPGLALHGCRCQNCSMPFEHMHSYACTAGHGDSPTTNGNVVYGADQWENCPKAQGCGATHVDAPSTLLNRWYELACRLCSMHHLLLDGPMWVDSQRCLFVISV